MYVCVYLSLCLSVFVSMCLYFDVSVCTVSVCLRLCVSVSQCVAHVN